MRTIETVAEENPLRWATSRMVTAEEGGRGRESRWRRDSVEGEPAAEDFEEAEAIDSRKCSVLLADTTVRCSECQVRSRV